jgi:hypothetical protein
MRFLKISAPAIYLNMRSIVLLLSAIFFVESLFAPTGRFNAATQISQLAHSVLYHQTFNIVPTPNVTAEEIRSRLPKGWSLLRWYKDTAEIKLRIERDPLIARAKVARCAWYSVNCFAVSAEERKPSFLVTYDGVAWIVADDGTFISPLGQNRMKNLSVNNLLKMRGVTQKVNSPDLARGRLSYLANAARVIESELGTKLASVELSPTGELKAQPANATFYANFNFSGKDLSRLGKEALRLRAVVDKLGPKMRLVREIDLAYQKMAVVRLVEAAST